MSRFRVLLAMTVASVALQGCIAAIVPIAAAGAIGGKKFLGTRDSGGSPDTADAAKPKKKKKEKIAEGAAASPLPQPAGPAMPTPAMQYLYGSGEAAAQSLQSYLALANYLLAASSDRAVGHAVNSVVLAPGSSLADPKFMPCGDKPLAVVLDIDETAVLNLGFESDQAKTGAPYDQQTWDAWEKTGGAKVVAAPGAADAVEVARGSHITVVFNSNRSAANADQTAAMLAGAKLGTAVHGDTLWLLGDAGGGSGKDQRRWAISAKYCVIAMIGDQLGDFSDLFNTPDMTIAARRSAIGSRNLEVLWGHGWFMMPNPVYGSGLIGSFDEVFPADKQWSAAPYLPPPAQPPEK